MIWFTLPGIDFDGTKSKKKLPLIETLSLSNKVKGYELHIVFNYYLFTKSEIVAPYKTRR